MRLHLEYLNSDDPQILGLGRPYYQTMVDVIDNLVGLRAHTDLLRLFFDASEVEEGWLVPRFEITFHLPGIAGEPGIPLVISNLTQDEVLYRIPPIGREEDSFPDEKLYKYLLDQLVVLVQAANQRLLERSQELVQQLGILSPENSDWRPPVRRPRTTAYHYISG